MRVKRPSETASLEDWKKYAESLEIALEVARSEKNRYRQAKHDLANSMVKELLRANLIADRETALREQAELDAAHHIRELNDKWRERLDK